MKTAHELFEKEGLLDELAQIKNKTLLHAEEFLKYSRHVHISEKTVVFGTVNRLHLIKNKMKNNQLFHENVECVDIKDIFTWVERELLASKNTDEIYDVPPQIVYTGEIGGGEPPDNSDDAEEKEFECHINFDTGKEEEIQTHEEIAVGNISDCTPEQEPENIDVTATPQPAGSIAFVFEYVVEQATVSSMSSGFSIYDYNPKELAYAYLKKLHNS